MKVKTVATVIAVDAAGRVVDAIPVRAAAPGETNIIGQPITPVPVIEDAAGVPIRVVVGKTATNSAGMVIESMAVSGLP